MMYDKTHFRQKTRKHYRPKRERQPKRERTTRCKENEVAPQCAAALKKNLLQPRIFHENQSILPSSLAPPNPTQKCASLCSLLTYKARPQRNTLHFFLWRSSHGPHICLAALLFMLFTPADVLAVNHGYPIPAGPRTGTRVFCVFFMRRYRRIAGEGTRK